MFLAFALNKYEEEIICDLAQTYHIYDYKKHKPSFIAILVKGLEDDSRLRVRVNKLQTKPSLVLQAGIIDRLNILIWQNTKDGAKNRNKPKPLLPSNEEKEKDRNYKVYADSKSFEKERKKLLKTIGG